jgi:hypothetical protein
MQSAVSHDIRRYINYHNNTSKYHIMQFNDHNQNNKQHMILYKKIQTLETFSTSVWYFEA